MALFILACCSAGESVCVAYPNAHGDEGGGTRLQWNLTITCVVVVAVECWLWAEFIKLEAG